MADETEVAPEDELTLRTSTAAIPRRRALWGVLALVAVAAGALAVTAGGDDGGSTPPPLPVALGAAASAETAAGTAADMRMAFITYLAGEGLPALGGEAPAYRLTGDVDEGRVRELADALGLAGDPVHEDSLWHLRTDAGMLEVYEDGGGSWWYSAGSFEGDAGVSSGGGSAGCEPGPAVDCGVAEPAVGAPTTTVVTEEAPPATIPGTAPAGDDCRTTTSADGSVVQECTGTAVGSCGPERCVDPEAPTCAPDAACTPPAEECPPNASCVAPEPLLPEPPADLPSEGDARQIALELLSSTGIDLTGAKVTVDGPYDAWYVTVEPLLDGLPVSGWAASVGVGSKGEVVHASGILADAERLGDYPVLDTRAAIDRLNEQQAGWFAYAPGTGGAMDAAGECAVQPDGREVCASVDVDCPDIAVDSDEVDGGSVDEPCPMPLPRPEPMEVTLHEAERILVLLPSFDGSGASYLLPGYRFSGDDGHLAEVAAVADESLAPTPETTVPATAVPEPAPVPPVGETEPSQPDLTHLSEGEEPEVGVAYYVDVNVMTGHCSWISVEFADEWYWAELSNDELAHWATPTEGGSFTLTAVGHAEFVGDTARTKVAQLALFEDGSQPPLCA